MQKTILKQQYENFTASRSEGLDKTYDRFQKLINQLEIHGDVISQKDANLKSLRSLPSAWNNIALFMRNKANLDELSMNDLYNNLKVYEAEIKSQSISNSNSQNVAFVSSDDTSSTNEAANTAHDVPAIRSKGQASSSTYANDVLFSFFVNQSNSPQLDNDDLKQIDTDDLEEMDLKWQVAMLTLRVKRFLKKTRNLNFNGKETVGFNKTKKWRCSKKDYTGGDSYKFLGCSRWDRWYDWSFEAEEGPTDFALMAHLSSGSSSSLSSDSKVRDNSETELKNQLVEALREKDDFKLKLENQMNKNELHDYHLNKSEVFESASDSSVNENEEENNQVNDRFKKVKGYHAVPPLYTRNYMPSRPNLSFVGLDDSIYKTNVSEIISSVPRIKSTASKSSKDSLEQPKIVRPSAPIIEEWESDSDDDCLIRPSFEQNKPSYAKINFVKSDKNTRKSIIEQHTYRQAENLRKSQSPGVDKRNWNGIMTQKLRDGFEFNKKACFVCGSLNHLIKDCNFYENKMVGKSVLNNMGRVIGQREVRPVWNNAQRVNHQNKLTHPHPKRNFVPTAVATKYGLVPINTAKQSSPRATTSISTARHVNIAVFKQKVNNVTTAGPEVVVSTAEGKRENAVNSSACWIWRPTRKVVDHISKDSGSYMPKRFDYVDPQGRLKLSPLSPPASFSSTTRWSTGLDPSGPSFNEKFFLATKDETSGILKTFITEIENQLDHKVKVIRCDNGTEFKNSIMNQFCEMKGIKREFSVVRTPHQNGVAERKNRTLIEAARTMLVDSKLPTTFWAEAVNTACYVLNRVLVIKPYNKIPYELIRGRPLLIDFMKPFGCHVTILNTREHLGKFDRKADKGYFVEYSVVSKAMRVFNKRARIVKETLNIRFLENTPNVKGNGPDWLFNVDSLTISMNYLPIVTGNQSNDIAGTKDNIVSGHAQKEKEPQEYILIPLCTTNPLISQGPKDSKGDAGMNPTKVDDRGDSDKNAQDTKSESERLNQREMQTEHTNSINSINTISTPVSTVGPSFDNAAPSPPVNTVGPSVSTANAYLEEEVDMNNVDTSYTTSDVLFTKFLKDHTQEQVIGSLKTLVQTRHMTKINEEHEEGIDYDEVFAPVARIEAIRLFLAYASFKDFVVYQMDVKSTFPYGKIEEIGVHENASRPDIMFIVCAFARFQVTPKMSHLHAVKRIFRYLKGQPKLGLWYPRDSPFDMEAFSDSEYAGASLDRKSTTGAEYVVAANYYGQVLWIQNQMLDYGFNFMNTKIYIDNESTICIVKNLVFHSKTKHIEIRHHFIRDCYEKKLIQVIKIHTDHNVAYLLTKAFDVSQFNFLIASIGLLNL
ncbi:putative ribonuclease H-like domain-containing protein [Tanacetum coccineum]